MKVVINRDFGGFGLSDEAIAYYGKLKGLNLIEVKVSKSELIGSLWYTDEVKDENSFFDFQIPRNDLSLVKVVEEMGEKANSRYANLVVVEIPDDVDWQVMEYDGREWVAEAHRTWN